MSNNQVQGKRPHKFASRYVLKYCTNILRIDTCKRDRDHAYDSHDCRVMSMSENPIEELYAY